MRVRRYTPNFVERDKESGDDVEVSSVEEMLALPYIQSWSTEPWFDHFVRDRPPFPDTQLLMAMLKNGKYYVVAFVDSQADLSALPEWVRPPDKKPQQG